MASVFTGGVPAGAQFGRTVREGRLISQSPEPVLRPWAQSVCVGSGGHLGERHGGSAVGRRRRPDWEAGSGAESPRLKPAH